MINQAQKEHLMASISLSSAKSVFGGSTEEETILKMAQKTDSFRIYKYANHFGDQKTHTDYLRITDPKKEKELLSSPFLHNVVLVFDSGAVLTDNLSQES
jgi:hypothetical protein